jgi:hypothetical protein
VSGAETTAIPVVDLTPFRTGAPADKGRVAGELDRTSAPLAPGLRSAPCPPRT